MIEVRQWHDEEGAWLMVCRCKDIDELRDDIKELVALIDAADGSLPNVGCRILIHTPNATTVQTLYMLDSNHTPSNALTW